MLQQNESMNQHVNKISQEGGLQAAQQRILYLVSSQSSHCETNEKRVAPINFCLIGAELYITVFLTFQLKSKEISFKKMHPDAPHHNL